MKFRPNNPSSATLKFSLAVSLFLLTVLFTLAIPAAEVHGVAPVSKDPLNLPQSINPDWKHLGITWRASVASDGSEGNSYVGEDHALSSDGRYVVFASYAWNLVPGDEKYGYEDIFLHDNQTGATERISVNSSGETANSDSFYGMDISADGRYVVFCTKASNLVTGDANGKWDVFVRDRQASTTTRVSVSSTGAQSNGNSWLPHISEDGHVVVYTSEASNLVTGDTNNKWDIFVYSMLNGQTERISVSSSGLQADGESGNNKSPAVSSDGRYVAFSSEATNLVSNDTNAFCDLNEDGIFNENCTDVFVRDRSGGTTERVSVNDNEEQGNNLSMLPAISGDGRYVAFYSWANNLVPNDTNTCLSLYYNSGPCPDVFVRDRQTGITERVSVSSSNGQSTVDPINYFKPPAISGDGRYVAFESSDTTLASGATNGYSQILIHDRTTHETTLVSANTYGWQGDEWSHCPPDISATGRYVSFISSSNDMVLYDANDVNDIFVRDREGWTYALEGTVRDEADHPIAGITVGYGSRLGESKETDTNGEYQLYYMPAGVYSIKAWKLGYIPDPIERLITVPPTTVGVDFVVRKATNFVYLPLVRSR